MKRTILTILALILSVSTVAACDSSEDAKVDTSESSPLVGDPLTPEEVDALPKETPKEFAEMLVGSTLENSIPVIEYNGEDGTPTENLSPAWRVIYNNANPQEMTLDIVDGRYNLVVEKGIIIGVIVEQEVGQDIAIGVTTPEAIAQAHGHSHEESFQTPEVEDQGTFDMTEPTELGSDGKALNLDCATTAFNGPIEMCSSENWEN